MDIDIYIHQKLPVTRIGLNGWLAPNGEFFQCPYQEHTLKVDVMYAHALTKCGFRRIARKLDEHIEGFVERIGYIAMGSKGAPLGVYSHCRVNTFAGITDAQAKFVKDNWDKLDEVQQYYYIQYKKIWEGYRDEKFIVQDKYSIWGQNPDYGRGSNIDDEADYINELIRSKTI